MKKILFILFSISCFSQPGSLDTSFNSGTSVFHGSWSQNINTIAVQFDGKLVVGGSFNSFNGITKKGLIRLNSDGSIDNTFATGIGINNDSSSAVESIVIQPDGKIIIAGVFYALNGIAYYSNILRLNTDGTVDLSFHAANFGDIHSIALQTDGKIVIGGRFHGYSITGPGGVQILTPCKSVVRLNSDGSLDSAFNVGLGPIANYNGDEVYKVVIQPNGKILVGGEFYAFDTKYGNGLARLNTDGSVDSTFEVYQGFQNTGNNYPVVYDIDITPDQYIYITGDFTAFDGIPSNKFIKLTPTGYKDFSFSIAPSLNLTIKNTSIQDNGKIVLCATGYNNGVYIWNAIRLNANGTNDDSFISGTNCNDLPRFSIIEPDGKILFSGPFTMYNGVTMYNIARVIGDTPSLNINENNRSTLLIYPNPATNHINLQVADVLSLDKIIITDMAGKEVMRLKNTANNINIENLESGMYILQAFSADKKLNTKFIKQ